jgi:diguanylate cyclase (GGDEF)-like protein
MNNATDRAQQLKGLEQAIEDLQRLPQALEDLVYRDELTSLLNRTAMWSLVVPRLAPDKPISVLYVEIDGFKNINSRHGHQAADSILGGVGTLIGAAVDSTSGLGLSVFEAFHLSGDEFVIVGSGADVKVHANTVASRVKADIEVQPIDVENSKTREPNAEVKVTVSAAFGNSPGEFKAVLDRADSLCECAKILALNRPEMPDVVTEEFEPDTVEAIRAVLSDAPRRRFHCPACHANGYVNIPVNAPCGANCGVVYRLRELLAAGR